MIVGLDVGGANTKFASSDGKWTHIEYLPLWKDAPLKDLLFRISQEIEPQSMNVVMTGELADCFSDKKEGIEYIKKTVEGAFSCPVHFWGVNGFQWHDIRELAAANWSASAFLLSEDIGDCIFVDMGSTTTDLIPIKKKPQAALSDFQRLYRGELIYSGRLRTNLAALLPSVEVEGQKVALSSELFAITADVYRALGDISQKEYRCDTPDGGGKDGRSSLIRLARTVCSDLEEIGETGALQIAAHARGRQIDVLRRALINLIRKFDLDLVVAAGAGEDLILQAAQGLNLNCLRLSDRYGKEVSEVFPAYAVAKLGEREQTSRD